MSDPSHSDPALNLLQRAVDGDTKAMRELVVILTPVIRAGVASVMSRGQRGGRREGKQEVEDVTQTVLLTLFADRGRSLLQWEPTRGLDLPSFVALLARNEALNVVRSRRRSPFTEDPTLMEDLDREPVARMGPESEAISKDMLAALADAVRERLRGRPSELFTLMYLEGRTIEEVCEMTGLTADAVYVHKSRLARQVREILDDLAATPPTQPPPALDGYERPKTGPMAAVPRVLPGTPAFGMPRVAKAPTPALGMAPVAKAPTPAFGMAHVAKAPAPEPADQASVHNTGIRRRPETPDAEPEAPRRASGSTPPPRGR